MNLKTVNQFSAANRKFKSKLSMSEFPINSTKMEILCKWIFKILQNETKKSKSADQIKTLWLNDLPPTNTHPKVA
jgi:hypothetical protein